MGICDDCGCCMKKREQVAKLKEELKKEALLFTPIKKIIDEVFKKDG